MRCLYLKWREGSGDAGACTRYGDIMVLMIMLLTAYKSSYFLLARIGPGLTSGELRRCAGRIVSPGGGTDTRKSENVQEDRKSVV